MAQSSGPPGPTPLDFFHWGYVKDRVYNRTSPTVESLKQKIEEVFLDLDSDPTLLRRVIESLPDRYQTCINEEGKQFEYLK